MTADLAQQALDQAQVPAQFREQAQVPGQFREQVRGRVRVDLELELLDLGAREPGVWLFLAQELAGSPVELAGSPVELVVLQVEMVVLQVVEWVE